MITVGYSGGVTSDGQGTKQEYYVGSLSFGTYVILWICKSVCAPSWSVSFPVLPID